MSAARFGWTRRLIGEGWLRGLDLNQRPSGYEPDELPGCSTPRHHAGRGGGPGALRPTDHGAPTGFRLPVDLTMQTFKEGGSEGL